MGVFYAKHLKKLLITIIKILRNIVQYVILF